MSETLEPLAALYLILGVVAVLGAGCLLRMSRREQAESRALLLEVSRTNAEFAEAMALFKYGAVDEAIEIASRAERRRAKASLP